MNDGSHRTLFRILACLALLLSLFIHAQAQRSPADLLKTRPVLVDRYSPAPGNTVLLPVGFNDAVITEPQNQAAYKSKTVTRVELIYSTYRLSDRFDQPALNLRRLEALQKLSPELFRNTAIEWVFTGQTEAKNEEEARHLFHGFAITYMERPDTTSSRKEIEFLTYVIRSDSLGHDTIVQESKYRVKKKRLFTGLYYPNSSRKRAKGIVYTKRSIWGRSPKYTFLPDTIFKVTDKRMFLASPTADIFLARLPDSVIFRVLERKKEWKNILFVCDVTGSMSPYSAELLVWNKLNFSTGRGKYFTFFNDGDNMDDRKKRIGRTGGIYHVKADSYNDVEEKAIYTIEKGNGGDAPENDIEALLSANAHFPDATEIVLIADNFANVKDLSLLGSVKKPVHIILCGVFNGLVNADYVELAYKTHGSVHTMEQDIENLARMKEGETIRIGNGTFKLQNGKFILVEEL